MSFRHYLEDEDDKPYYNLNTLSYYYEDMERKRKLVEELAKQIFGYDQKLGLSLTEIEQRVASYLDKNQQQLKQWDAKVSSLDTAVEAIVQNWVADGSLELIVQDSVLNLKADKEDVNVLSQQLAEKVGGQRKLLPEELSDEAMALVTGNGTVNVLSEPQKESVDFSKLTPDVLDVTHSKVGLGEYEIGTISASTGLPSGHASRIRPKGFVTVQNGFVQFIADGRFEYGVFMYDKSTYAPLSSTEWSQNPYYKIPYAECAVKVIMRKVANTAITESEIPDFLSSIVVFALKKLEIKKGFINPTQTDFIVETNGERINQFDKKAIRSGGYYAGGTGIWTSSTTASSSNPIPVQSGDVLRLKALTASGYHIVFRNADNQYLTGENFSLLEGQLKEIPVPAGAAFFLTAVKNVDIEQFMVVKNIDYPSQYFSYNENVGDYAFPDKFNQSLQKAVEDSFSNGLNGKKLGVVSDSIPSNYRANGNEYPFLIAREFNMVLNHLGIPGSLIAKSDKTGHVDTHMCEMVKRLDQDCELIMVAGGRNDERYNVPLGVMGDTNIETFYGAMDSLCRNLIERFPKTPKAVFTPIKSRGTNEKTKPYVSAMKEVCARYGIPVLDLFTICDLQPDIDFINNTYFYQADGIHPIEAGHLILKRPVRSFLLNLV